jgi:hypothetical protein
MPQPEFSTRKDGNLTLFTASRQGTPVAMVAISPLNGKALDLVPLMTTLARFAEVAPVEMKPLNEAGWKERAPKLLEPIANAARDMQKATIAYSQELAGRWQGWIVPPKTVSPQHLLELRAYAREQKPADLLRLVLADGLIAVAVLELPAGIPGLNDPAIRAEIERAAALYGLKNLYSGQTQRKPSMDDILAHGLDDKALQQLAEDGLRNYRLSLADIETVRGVIERTVIFYALAADVDVKLAFDNMGLGK